MEKIFREYDGGFKYLPIELYATESGYHVFDAKKVVFLDVDEVVFGILKILRKKDLGIQQLFSLLPQYAKEDVRDSFNEIKALQAKGYLKPYQFRRRGKYSRAYFEDTLAHKVSGFTVYVTTRCNLACSYCIYGGEYDRYEKLSQTTMTWKTARNMVDFLMAHSAQSKNLRLDFFGGEPLLNFDLMRRIVKYARSRLGTSRLPIVVTIASNGTILTEEILQFLLEHNVYLQFSIDGDKEVHDRERRFRNGGNGSHDLILRNLERIYMRYPDYFREHIHVKSVMTMKTISSGDDAFFRHPLIQTVNRNGHLSTLIKEPHYDISKDRDYFRQFHALGKKLLKAKGIKTLKELLEPFTLRERIFFQQTFNEFTEVQSVNNLYFGNATKIPFTKGCLMGYQEGAVQPNGDITVCHKATSFVIGNVNEGTWYGDRIWELNSKLHEALPECTSCFAHRFCGLCYEKLDGRNGCWTKARAKYCEFTRQKYHLSFDYMLRILDKNPELWDDLGKLVETKIADRLKEMDEELQDERRQ